MELIEDEALLKLNMHISDTGCLEEGAFCFIEVIGDNEETNKDSKKVKTVSDSKKGQKKRLYIKKREMRRLYYLQPLVRLRLQFLCLGRPLFHLRLHLFCLCLCLGPFFRLCLHLRLLYLCLCLGWPLFCLCLLYLCLCLSHWLPCLCCLCLVCLCQCLGSRLLRLYLVYLCLYLDCLLFRLNLVDLCVCLGHLLFCLHLLCLCLDLGSLPRLFLSGLPHKHQCLFQKNEE